MYFFLIAEHVYIWSCYNGTWLQFAFVFKAGKIDMVLLESNLVEIGCTYPIDNYVLN